MVLQVGLYPDLYVKRKDLLFPLIEKYSGVSLKGKTHIQVLELYYNLLTGNWNFKSEVDAIIENNFKNAGGEFRYGGDVGANTGEYLGKVATTTTGEYLGKVATTTGSEGTKTKGKGIFSGIVSAVGNIFGAWSAGKTAQAQSDAAFYAIVLNAQQRDDTIKLLVVSGIALAFVGLGVVFVIKMKKK